jgi:hypothetical protein
MVVVAVDETAMGLGGRAAGELEGPLPGRRRRPPGRPGEPFESHIGAVGQARSPRAPTPVPAPVVAVAAGPRPGQGPSCQHVGAGNRPGGAKPGHVRPTARSSASRIQRSAGWPANRCSSRYRRHPSENEHLDHRTVPEPRPARRWCARGSGHVQTRPGRRRRGRRACRPGWWCRSLLEAAGRPSTIRVLCGRRCNASG